MGVERVDYSSDDEYRQAQQMEEWQEQKWQEEQYAKEMEARMIAEEQEKESVPLDPLVSGILADFENLLIDVMGSRKCSIGSLENYYELHLEVKRINELYSKIQEYQIVSQNSR